MCVAEFFFEDVVYVVIITAPRFILCNFSELGLSRNKWGSGLQRLLTNRHTMFGTVHPSEQWVMLHWHLHFHFIGSIFFKLKYSC